MHVCMHACLDWDIREFILSLPGRFGLKTWKVKGAMLYSKKWLVATMAKGSAGLSKNPPNPTGKTPCFACEHSELPSQRDA